MTRRVRLDVSPQVDDPPADPSSPPTHDPTSTGNPAPCRQPALLSVSGPLPVSGPPCRSRGLCRYRGLCRWPLFGFRHVAGDRRARDIPGAAPDAPSPERPDDEGTSGRTQEKTGPAKEAGPSVRRVRRGGTCPRAPWSRHHDRRRRTSRRPGRAGHAGAGRVSSHTPPAPAIPPHPHPPTSTHPRRSPPPPPAAALHHRPLPADCPSPARRPRPALSRAGLRRTASCWCAGTNPGGSQWRTVTGDVEGLGGPAD
jgi:hypothetical protein